MKTGSSFRFDQVADTETLVHRLRLAELPVGEALEHLRAIVTPNRRSTRSCGSSGTCSMALGFALCFRMSFAASIAAVLIAIPIGAISCGGSVKGTPPR